jgi:hypothetical protein
MTRKGRPLATRLIVLFATEPELRLSAEEIAYKFDTPRRHVCTTLRYAVSNGWISKTPRYDSDRKTRPIIDYMAGPTLLEELG